MARTQGELIYGIHAVGAALRDGVGRIAQIWVAEGARGNARIGDIITAAKAAHIPLNFVGRDELDKLSIGAVHQGVAARLGQARVFDEADLEALVENARPPALLLVLDGVQDPHNLGACLRTANAAGVQAVIAPRDRAVGLTPVVRKVASGAAEITPFIQVTNLARTLRLLKEQGVWLIGADGAAETSLYDADLRGPIAIVLGAEGGGLRRLTKEHCDYLVKIPLRGQVESLNVSVACGICLFEALRQRSG